MVERSRAEILKDIRSLPSTREIFLFPETRAFVIAAGVAFLLTPMLSLAVATGYAYRVGAEYLSVRGKRTRLTNEYLSASGGMEN